MRMAAVWMVGTIGLTATGMPAGAEPATDVRAYAVFALAGASIGARARVQGDVGSLADAVTLGTGTRVSGLAAAPAIRVHSHARADGGYFCTSVEGTTDSCTALADSFVGAPSIVLVAPGNFNVSAPRRSKSATPLAPGAYGALVVGSAAQVRLAGGSYAFTSLAVGSRAKVLCESACDIAVAGAVRIGAAARFGAGDGVPASGVTLRIASHAEPVALDAKSRASIQASVYAPTADVRLAAAVKASGGIVGNTVTIGPRARLAGPDAG